MFEILVQDTLTVMDRYVVATGESKGTARIGDMLVDEDKNEYRVAAILMDSPLVSNSKRATIAFHAAECSVDDIKGKIGR